MIFCGVIDESRFHNLHHHSYSTWCISDPHGIFFRIVQQTKWLFLLLVIPVSDTFNASLRESSLGRESLNVYASPIMNGKSGKLRPPLRNAAAPRARDHFVEADLLSGNRISSSFVSAQVITLPFAHPGPHLPSTLLTLSAYSLPPPPLLLLSFHFFLVSSTRRLSQVPWLMNIHIVFKLFQVPLVDFWRGHGRTSPSVPAALSPYGQYLSVEKSDHSEPGKTAKGGWQKPTRLSAVCWCWFAFRKSETSETAGTNRKFLYILTPCWPLSKKWTWVRNGNLWSHILMSNRW